MTTIFPDETTEALVARARSHMVPTYKPVPLFLVRGEGPWVWDRDGKRYLDMVAGIAVNALGHAHPRLVAAIRAQADDLIHVSNLYYNEPALALMDALTAKSFADHVFFANSGAEANEAAIKLARRYRAAVTGEPERTEILAFHKSFHGRTMAALSATGQTKYHDGLQPMVQGFRFADFGDRASVSAALDAAKGRVGAIMLEPIQCEGGLNVPPEGFLRWLRKEADKRDALLIFDEVQTGVGRTGELFAYEHDGVAPDVMTLAKGLAGGVPMGAMLCSTKVAPALGPGTHASTFGGNPLAARAALEVLRVIDDEHLLDRVYEVGTHLGEGLKRLVAKHPGKALEARGVGLLWGLELAEGLAPQVVASCQERGVLLNAIGGRVLRFVPPLIVDPGHVDAALAAVDETLGEAPAP